MTDRTGEGKGKGTGTPHRAHRPPPVDAAALWDELLAADRRIGVLLEEAGGAPLSQEVQVLLAARGRLWGKLRHQLVAR